MNTPLFLPISQNQVEEVNGADTRRRWRPPFLRDVRRHIAAAWFLKSGYHFRWNGPLYRIVRDLMRVFRACEIMAAWDVFLDEPRKSYDLYLLHSRMASLMDHPHFKILRDRYDQWMISRRRGRGF